MYVLGGKDAGLPLGVFSVRSPDGNRKSGRTRTPPLALYKKRMSLPSNPCNFDHFLSPETCVCLLLLLENFHRACRKSPPKSIENEVSPLRNLLLDFFLNFRLRFLWFSYQLLLKKSDLKVLYFSFRVWFDSNITHHRCSSDRRSMTLPPWASPLVIFLSKTPLELAWEKES